MVCNPNGVASVCRQHPSRMTPAVERQFAIITSRLEGKNGCNWREKEYAQLCVGAGYACPFYHAFK